MSVMNMNKIAVAMPVADSVSVFRKQAKQPACQKQIGMTNEYAEDEGIRSMGIRLNKKKNKRTNKVENCASAMMDKTNAIEESKGHDSANQQEIGMKNEYADPEYAEEEKQILVAMNKVIFPEISTKDLNKNNGLVMDQLESLQDRIRMFEKVELEMLHKSIVTTVELSGNREGKEVKEFRMSDRFDIKIVAALDKPWHKLELDEPGSMKYVQISIKTDDGMPNYQINLLNDDYMHVETAVQDSLPICFKGEDTKAIKFVRNAVYKIIEGTLAEDVTFHIDETREGLIISDSGEDDSGEDDNDGDDNDGDDNGEKKVWFRFEGAEVLFNQKTLEWKQLIKAN